MEPITFLATLGVMKLTRGLWGAPTPVKMIGGVAIHQGIDKGVDKAKELTSSDSSPTDTTGGNSDFDWTSLFGC